LIQLPVLRRRAELSFGSFPDIFLSEVRRGKGRIGNGSIWTEEKRQRRLQAELAAQTTTGW